MSIVSQQIDSYVIKANNTIEFIALGKPKAVFRKLWIYPGVLAADGTVTDNTGPIRIGVNGDGPKIVTDVIQSGDAPMLIEMPEATGEQMHIGDLLIYGTANDGVILRYWP